MSELAVTLRIRRTRGWEDFAVSVPEGAYLLDALEEAGRQDETLLFRHACHHASCGSCGVRANGCEVLACVTPVRDLAQKSMLIRVEPLRNFPVLGDLLVDTGQMFRRLDALGFPLIRSDEATQNAQRFENCIECGLCVSACPAANTDSDYAGPVALAAAWRLEAEPRGVSGPARDIITDHEHGLWRCHSAFECSQVCPSNVDPAGAIMRLRRKLILRFLKLSR